METDTKQIQDPREQGTKGLSGLSSAPKQERPDGLHFGTTAAEYRAIQNYRNKTASPIQKLGQYYPEAGSSKYDEKVESLTDLENLQEFRAQEQPWYDQIANGALKMVTTAATTFVDGTVGSLWGLGTGVANLLDDDPSTSFWRGMWDNAVTNKMADLNDKMEEVAHNYRSEWEENASVFERMFSPEGAANFWGDDILKNAGFTIGAAGAIWATGSLGGWLKAPQWAAKLGKGVGLLAKGADGAMELTKAGKVASNVVKTFVSAQGEAAIETLNSTRESLKAMDAEIDVMRQTGSQNALLEYEANTANGMDGRTAKAIYDGKLSNLDNDLQEYEKHMQQELTDAGNMIYAANIAVLSVSNNLTLGSMIRGGYGNSKSLLSQAVKTAEGKPVTSAEEAGKALLKGTLKFDVPKVDNAMAKTMGHWALTSAQEGFEEGAQNLASNTGQILAEARTHKWAKENTMLDNLIDSDADDDLVNYSKALGKAFEEQFGSLNSPGWTEVVAGFLTGALGVASVHRNSKGQIRPTWQGGLKESRETVNGNRDAVVEVANKVNQALTNDKFVERAKHAVEQIAIKKGQDEALQDDDTRVFKNLEVQQLLSDAVFFRDMGMLDDYLSMYKEMANGVSDEDVAELKAAAKGEDGSSSSLELKSDDEIKALYQDKAKSTLEKINKALEDYEQIENNYGDKFSDGTRREALTEMSFLNTLYWDTQRRAEEIRKEVEDLSNNEKRTPLDDLKLSQQQKALTDLEKQATELRDSLNEYKNDPKKLQTKVEKKQLDRQKRALYKQAQEAINKYKDAETPQDVVDVYSHSPEENREQVLDQAIAQAEGETKTKLQQFRNYMGDVNTIEYLIEEKFLSDVADNPMLKIRKAQVFQSILNEAVNEMLSEESPTLTRETLKEKLQTKAKEFQEEIDSATEEAHGVTIGENDSYDFTSAYDEGTVTDEDFEEVLDNEETGESHHQIKEGTDAAKFAEVAAKARDFKNLLDDLNYFIDSLDKLDELREAGKKKEEEKKKRKKGEKELKKDTKKRGGTHVDVEEEVIEGDDSSEGSESFEGSDEAEDFGEPSSSDEDSDEDIGEPAPVKKAKPLLTASEKTHYDVQTERGESGVSYNTLQKKGPKAPDNVKPLLAKKLRNTDEKLNYLEKQFNNTKSQKRKQELVDEMLDVVKNNVIGAKTVKAVDKFFKANKKYLKPASTKESSAPGHSNESQQSLTDSEVSMNGNQHAAYVGSELSKKGKMVAVTYQRSGETPVQVWLEEQGFNTQEVIDNHLGKVIHRDREKAVKDKTPIHYLHTTAQPKAIFLGVEYSKVSDVIPMDVAKKLVKAQDGKEYLIVGSLGWERARSGTEEMYNGVLESFEGNEYTDEGWTVNTEHTNRIKDIEAGYTVKQTLSDSKAEVRDLRDLLASERNPHGLQLEDLSWTVIEGTEEAPTRKVINGEVGDTYAVKGGKPGQVYLNIPASNGKLIPVYMETMGLSELEEDTPLYKEVARLVSILADPDATMQDKKSAMGNLNDLLIFAPKLNQLHVNDESYKYAPNTITITKDGQTRTVIDFDEGTGIDADELLQEVIALNPRINLSTTVLSRDPHLYLESGVLKTDIALLGTVNSRFFTYPIDSNGEYVKNKPFSGIGKTYDTSTRNRIYVGGKYVYYDGNKFTDVNGEVIDDEDGTLTDAIKIKQGKIKPTKLGKVSYYVVGDTVYADNGHGGLNIVDEALKQKVLSLSSKKTTTSKRKEAAKEEAKKIDKKKKNSPVEEDSRLKGKAPQVDEEGDSWDEDSSEEKERAEEYFKGLASTVATPGNKTVSYLVSDSQNLLSDLYKACREDSIKMEEGPLKQALDLMKENPSKLEWHVREKNGKRQLLIRRKSEEDWHTPEALAEILEGSSVDPSAFGIGDTGGSSGKSNFTNGTNIDEIKSHDEIEAEVNSSAFTAVLGKRENRAKARELYSTIESKLGVRVNSAAQAIAELSKPEHAIDLSSNDIDTIIEEVKNCRG